MGFYHAWRNVMRIYNIHKIPMNIMIALIVRSNLNVNVVT
ncbi:hypothetical protein AC520_0358 [Enterobacter sp. OLF]|nr:hypothetical protein AC520_0358 [Enterobacter sp. OLF]